MLLLLNIDDAYRAINENQALVLPQAVMCVGGDCEVELVEPMSPQGTGKTFKVS